MGLQMQRIKFRWVRWDQGFRLGVYATWRDANVDGIQAGLAIGFWSIGVQWVREQTLADKMIDALKKL